MTQRVLSPEPARDPKARAKAVYPRPALRWARAPGALAAAVLPGLIRHVGGQGPPAARPPLPLQLPSSSVFAPTDSHQPRGSHAPHMPSGTCTGFCSVRSSSRAGPSPAPRRGRRQPARTFVRAFSLNRVCEVGPLVISVQKKWFYLKTLSQAAGTSGVGWGQSEQIQAGRSLLRTHPARGTQAMRGKSAHRGWGSRDAGRAPIPSHQG